MITRNEIDEKIEELERQLSELGDTPTGESAAPISTKKRNTLDDEKFAVPGKRKLPLDTCARVRNAMSRFSQTQGLTPPERRTAYSKIMRAAKKCGIDSTGFQEKYGKK